MSQVFPAVSAMFHKHRELVNQDFSSHTSRPALDSSFDEFGAGVLTGREKEVAKLVLTGHSSESISLRLGTSVATIKTHRRNIHSKLETGSQAELFFRFIEFLTTRSTPWCLMLWDDGFASWKPSACRRKGCCGNRTLGLH